MEDDQGAADDERLVELSSIAAIFPELVFDIKSQYRASLSIPVTPAVPLKVGFQQLADSVPNLPTPPTSTEPDGSEASAIPSGSKKTAPAGSEDVHTLVHLPPLELKIDLPDEYPAKRPPKFHLTCTPSWIPSELLHRLTKDGTKLWEDQGRDQVIYTYIDHLQQAAEVAFGLDKTSNHDLMISGDLKIALLDYDLRTKRQIFEKETFDCGVCLEPKKGTFCHRLLLCSHVFCVECLQECYNKCVAEGDVDNVKCLDPGCSKNQAEVQRIGSRKRRLDTTLTPSELLQVPISEERVQRYVHLKRKRKLESDKNTVYCPREWCQGAARSKKHPKPIDPMHDVDDVVSDSEPESQKAQQTSKNKEVPMGERLCICEDCNYAFCSVCRKGWHGEMISYSLCNPRSEKELSEEEKATAEYLALHSTPCPTCEAPCQKTMGCNHMICFKCRTHFCYLCSSYLSEDNPYQHFNDKFNPCYMRLWELEDGDDENAEGVAWDEPPDDILPNSDDGSESEEEDMPIGQLNFNNGHGPPIWGDAVEPAALPPPAPAPPPHPAEPLDMRIEIVNYGRDGAPNHIIEQIMRAPILPRDQFPLPAPDPAFRAGRAPQLQRGRGGGPPNARGARNQAQNAPRGRGRGRGQIRGAVAARNDHRPAPHRAPNHPALAAPPLAPDPPPAARIDPDPPHIADSDSSDTENEVPLRFNHNNPRPAPGQGNDGQQNPAMLRQVGIDRFLQLAEQDLEDEWDSDELGDEVGSDGEAEDLFVVDPLRRRAGVRRMGWRE